ncbi:MAG: site-specific DNA-methyltransferase [Candidatus Parcubacteria bacterium]|nr:site-specific DNA-methyltransferase [Candidatus Parcubacteria bacterium]
MTFKQTVEKILKTEETFLDTETKELNYTKVKDSADKIDPKLIALLADHTETKEKFFTKIKDVYVFNINDFKFFLDENKINNSYTQFANQIGLSDGPDFLKDRGEVVLGFPYKDCVLEGGQSTEEGTDTYFEYSDKSEKYNEKEANRNEIFFNQVLARDEIDRLFDKKALINWKRYTKDSGKNGEAVKDIERDEKGTIKENLVVKGNNLLALHSLKAEFTGKIKLIYIDPPYNRDADAFYNDNFNHSTWLTFIKNRLEVAKGLLKDDGIIFVQCDDTEQAYLKVLMDEVFSADNFLNTISVQTKVSSGASGGGEDKKMKKNSEFILFYCKDKNNFDYTPIYKTTSIEKYIEDHKKEEIGFYYTRVLVDTGKKTLVKEIDGIKIYKHTGFKFDTISNIKKDEGLSVNEAYKKYFDKIFMVTNVQTSLLTKVNNVVNEKDALVSYEYIPKSGKSKNKVSTKYIWNKTLVVWFADTAVIKDGLVSKLEEIGSSWTDISWGRIDIEGGVLLKSGKKPEKLLQRIIELGSSENDIVLDFFAGTGTTLAVAHKTGRQYLGIEQLDYIHDLPEARLINVINGDQTGISKEVNWKGGGSFIYCELAKWNEQAKEEINGAKDYKALEKMFDTLYEKYFFNYNVKIKEFKEKILKEENFKKLTLDEQKRMFLTMLDLNQMYVQESEMGDKRFDISKEDQKLTKAFYSK